MDSTLKKAATGMAALRQMNRSKAKEPGDIYKNGAGMAQSAARHDMRKPMTEFKGAASTTPRALAATPRAPARGKADLARPKPAAPRPAAPRPAAPKMTDGQKLRASLRADKGFMDSIKPAAPAVFKAAAKAAAKAAPKADSKTVRGYDSYKRFVGE